MLVQARRYAQECEYWKISEKSIDHEDLGARAQGWLVDPFSSGVSFTGWKELAHREVMWRVPETYAPMIVWIPRTWLLSEGWRRHGLIPCGEVPRAPREKATAR